MNSLSTDIRRIVWTFAAIVAFLMTSAAAHAQMGQFDTWKETAKEPAARRQRRSRRRSRTPGDLDVRPSVVAFRVRRWPASPVSRRQRRSLDSGARYRSRSSSSLVSAPRPRVHNSRRLASRLHGVGQEKGHPCDAVDGWRARTIHAWTAATACWKPGRETKPECSTKLGIPARFSSSISDRARRGVCFSVRQTNSGTHDSPRTIAGLA